MITKYVRKRSYIIADYSGNNNISEFKPLEHDVQQIINIGQSKYAITAQLQGGGTNDRKNIIFSYNSISGKVSDVTTIPLNGLTNVYDSHRRASIDIDFNGYIYMAEEKGKNSTGHSDGHNTELYIWKSTQPQNTSSFTKIKTLTGAHCYPNLQRVGNLLFLTSRENPQTENVFYDVSIPENASQKTFIELTGVRAYPRYIASDDAWYYHIVNSRSDANVNWPNVYFLKTQDGTNWYNASESWNKNTTINQSEATANLLVVSASNQITGNVLFISGHSTDGQPKMLIMLGDNSGETREGNPAIIFKELRWYYYSDGWQYTDITSFFPEDHTFYAFAERYFISTKTVDNEYIYVIDPDDNRSVYEYKSKNNFQTYTKRKILEGNGNYLMGNISTRNVSQKDILLCVYDTEGTWWAGTDYNWDGYSNLIFIRP